MTQRQKAGRKKNTGIPYEIAVQRIFQEILDREPARTIKVDHDVQVQGQIACHQIDVLWKFTVADIDHLTVVQARDWNQMIKQESVFAFRQILNDIPGQPRGVIVTRRGFQRGARKFGKEHGIELFILRQGSPRWTIQSSADFPIHVEIKFEGYRLTNGGQGALLRATFFRPHPRVKLTVDPLPNRSQQQRLVERLAKKHLHKIELFNANKQLIGNLRDVLVDVIEMMKKNNQLSGAFNKSFSDPTFLVGPNSKIFMRLSSLQAEICIEKHDLPPVCLKPPGFVDFVLENLGTGMQQSFVQSAKK